MATDNHSAAIPSSSSDPDLLLASQWETCRQKMEQQLGPIAHEWQQHRQDWQDQYLQEKIDQQLQRELKIQQQEQQEQQEQAQQRTKVLHSINQHLFGP